MGTRDHSNSATQLPLTEAEQVIRTYCDLKREFYMLEHLEGVIVGDKIRSEAFFEPEERPHQIRFRDGSHCGWKKNELTYTPLAGLSSNRRVEGGFSPEDLIDELQSHREWQYRRKAYPHLRERHWGAVDTLKTACSPGTKKEMLKAVVAVLNQSNRSLNDRIFDRLPIQPDGATLALIITKKAGLAEMFDAHITYAQHAISGRLFEEVGEATKNKVKDRDGEQCVVCENTDGLVYHHIIPVNEGGSGDAENVAMLCADCHREAHGETWGVVWYDSKEEFWEWVENRADTSTD